MPSRSRWPVAVHHPVHQVLQALLDGGQLPGVPLLGLGGGGVELPPGRGTAPPRPPALGRGLLGLRRRPGPGRWWRPARGGGDGPGATSGALGVVHRQLLAGQAGGARRGPGGAVGVVVLVEGLAPGGPHPGVGLDGGVAARPGRPRWPSPGRRGAGLALRPQDGLPQRRLLLPPATPGASAPAPPLLHRFHLRLRPLLGFRHPPVLHRRAPNASPKGSSLPGAQL